LITKNSHLAVGQLSRNKGSGLIEILIALAVLSLSIGAVILLTFANQNLKVDVETNNEGVSIAQGLIEDLRAQARQDFGSVVTVAPTTPDGYYTRGAVVTNIDFFTKLITSTATWYESATRPVTVTFSTVVTDPETAIGGDTCTDEFIGDWSNPQRLGYGDITSNTGATGLDAFNHKVYLTTDPSGGPQDDFYIFDVSDPSPPGNDLPILGSLDTTYGLEDVRVAGRYVYVVAADTWTVQLLTIDALNSANPVIVAQLDVTAPGIDGYGNTLAYSDGKIYLGLTKSAGPELHVIDVSNPVSPSVIGTLETNSAVNHIVIDRDNDLAYLAVASSTAGQLWKVDISNPASPAVLQKFLPGASNWVGQGVALSKTTSDIFLGRINTVGPTAVDLYVLDSADITQPPLDTVTQTKDDGFMRMVIRSGLLLASNNQPNLGFQVWNVADPTNLTMLGSVNIQQASTAGMDCEGETIFIGQRSNRALQIIGPGL